MFGIKKGRCQCWKKLSQEEETNEEENVSLAGTIANILRKTKRHEELRKTPIHHKGTLVASTAKTATESINQDLTLLTQIPAEDTSPAKSVHGN